MQNIITKIFSSRFGLNFLLSLRDRQRINIALTKGGISLSNRKVNLKNPLSWEFSGFSQNGEDGIIDVLCDQIVKESNKYFIEIGAADGIDNNSAWPLITKKYNGLMIEADKKLVKSALRIVKSSSNSNNHGLQIIQQFVSIKNIDKIKKITQFSNPDFMSLDIDSMDYYVAEKIFETGFRPKIFVVEYNSVFGPDNPSTIQYNEDFIFGKDHPSFLYYGVGIAAWKHFFKKNNYKFITTDSNGVNAFFVDPEFFSEEFLSGINQNHFFENQLQKEKFRCDHSGQFKKIKHLPFFNVTS
tara:strand:- start:2282 stop:3178 length:897 start_codon:yes stop_codon:yes gene_type:complete